MFAAYELAKPAAPYRADVVARFAERSARVNATVGAAVGALITSFLQVPVPLVSLPHANESYDMKPVPNLEESPGKIVGHRHPPADGLAMTESRSIKDARAWQRALRTLPIPKGVYRFRTHEEADEWLWQMLTRPRR